MRRGAPGLVPIPDPQLRNRVRRPGKVHAVGGRLVEFGGERAALLIFQINSERSHARFLVAMEAAAPVLLVKRIRRGHRHVEGPPAIAKSIFQGDNLSATLANHKSRRVTNPIMATHALEWRRLDVM